jgi:hypothetical protein
LTTLMGISDASHTTSISAATDKRNQANKLGTGGH